MQNRTGKPNTPQKNQAPKSSGRVIDMRSWKAQRRLRNARGGRGWPQYVLLVSSWGILVLAAVLALVGCFPIDAQISTIVWCATLSITGCALGIWLYVLRDRSAMRIIKLYLVCLALSVTVAAVKIY